MTNSERSYPVSEVTLHALEGTPLQHEPIREMVIATARAIAERQGVNLINIKADDASVTIQVEGEEIIAIGLIAELRRLTTNWYNHKFGVDSLWGDVSTQE